MSQRLEKNGIGIASTPGPVGDARGSAATKGEYNTEMQVSTVRFCRLISAV
jgi:hypothetical protein